MGEYAEKDGRRIKLGTCEDLMYVTRGDVVALKAAGWKGDGGAADMNVYLSEKSLRYRLAIEADVAGDPIAIGQRKPELPTVRIPIQAESALCDFVLDSVDHGQCYTNFGNNYGNSPALNGARLVHPCPLSRKWRAEVHGVKLDWRQLFIEIAMEGAANGRAVYRCPFCGTMFNLYGDQERDAELRALVLDAYRATEPPGMYRAYVEGLIAASPAVPVLA